jgi:RNA polymerase sigma-70 factor, ECF subfamily
VTFIHRTSAHDDEGGLAAIFDRRWQRKALKGDSEAIALLARQVLEPLYRFCLHRVGRNHALAEDVAQQTMLVAIERLESYDPDRSNGSVWGWVTGLARNEIRRALSHSEFGNSVQQFWQSADGRLLEALRNIESESISDKDMRRSETRELVNVTMSQLPVHYQLALEAKYMKGESLRQMATGLRMSVEAVESLLSRSRRAFRDTFEALSRSIDDVDKADDFLAKG